MPDMPNRGDIIWVDFNPQAGREQAGRRPALVLSKESYNRKVGLLICCPITSHKKGYPFEYALPDTLDTKGVVLVDQIKSIDWRKRNTTIKERVHPSDLGNVLTLLQILIFDD